MDNVVKSIKVFKKLTQAKWKHLQDSRNCVYFRPCEGKTKWYFSDLRQVAYGELDLAISKPILIPSEALSKVKRVGSFEFLEDGLKINGITTRAYDGSYPDIEKVLNPYETTSYTIKANFQELGTLLEALKRDVTISVENGDLRFHQTSYARMDPEMETFITCEGDLPFAVRQSYKLFSLMAKENVKEITIKIRSEERSYLTFETSFCKFFCLNYAM